MTEKRTPPTPEEILASVESSDVDAEIERALALSPAERRAEVQAAGYDLAALDAKADAVHDAARRAVARAQAENEARRHASEPPRRRPGTLWLLAAAVVVVAGAAWFATRSSPQPPPAPSPPPTAPTRSPAPSPELVARANEARARAFAQCARSEWFECTVSLDQARDLDPAGDTAPEVMRARDRAMAAMNAPPADAGRLK